MTEQEFRGLFGINRSGKKIWCDTEEEYCTAIDALEDMGYEIGEGSGSSFRDFEYQDFIEMYHVEFLGDHREPETAEDPAEAEAIFLSVLTAME